MATKEIKVDNKKYTIRELKYKDLAETAGLTDKAIVGKKMMMMSTDMSEEEYEELTLRAGLKLINAINELNGLTENFQQTGEFKTNLPSATTLSGPLTTSEGSP